MVQVAEAHAVFRRTCFEYNIPIDYRDWTTEGSLIKAFSDPNSFLYIFRKFNKSSYYTNHLYNLNNDAFLFAWLIAPPVRKHSCFVGSFIQCRPPYTLGGSSWITRQERFYLPYIISPAHLYIDSIEDLRFLYSNSLP
jgi:hypothetical protein